MAERQEWEYGTAHSRRLASPPAPNYAAATTSKD